MKRLTGSFFRSFQFRLLAYLLVVGSVPLFLSFYVFYRQSADFSDQSISRDIRSAHELMLGSLKREMSAMDTFAGLIVEDPSLNKLIEQSGMTVEALDDRLAELVETGHTYPVYTVCLNTGKIRSSGCSALLNETGAHTEDGEGKRFELVRLAPDHWEKQFGILLYYPVSSPYSKTVKTQVTVLYNVSKLLGEFKNTSSSVLRQTLFDEQRTAYSQDLRDENDHQAAEELAGTPRIIGDRIVDELPLNLEGYNLNWTYRLEVKNVYMSGSRKSLQTTVLVLLALLAALSFGSSLVFSRFFTMPIHHLRTLMKRAEIGDLKAYWTSRGAGEIEDLGESYNQMLFRIDELFRQVKLEEALKKEKEIEALQYQLNPHFLYNTLNTIKWVAKIHKTPQISDVVSSLVRLLQASLGKKGDFLTIKEEVKLIQDYMEIQAFRYGEKVKMHYDIEPIASLCLVPRMIMQPLVENAIIHGIEPSGREGVISIKAWLERDLLFCQVEDNGIGLPESDLETGGAPSPKGVKEKLSGIGLRHIRQKIKLYYGPDYKMHVYSRRGEGTTIRLSLPIHRGEEE